LFITPVDKYTYEFKSLTLWKLIYKEAQKDLLYKENSQRLYYTLRPLTLSSNLQKLISCTEALNKDEEYIIWQETASISAKLGDTNLYIIAQKQCLKLIEEQKAEDKEEEKAQIYEKIGKLLCEKSPVEAITYLSNVLDADIKANNTQKVIDLSGYFIKSCYLTGNYFGANEACNAVIAAIKGVDSDVSDLEIALIKTRKLNALFNIGNSEQIVNLVKEEILPELNKGLISLEITMEYKSLVINAWFTSNLVLAMAYGQQGNNEIFNTITELRQFCEKYEYNNFINNTRIDLIEAFANTVIGQIAKSNELLNIISEKYKSKNMEPKLLAQWNFLNIINRVLSGQFEDLKGDLFELAAFANNINEHFIKNIVKLILGYVIKEDGNIKKALEIYQEEITYFAKEKVAIGALLAWALIVKLNTESGDYDKALNTAQRALEIAQSPKINNYFFIIYFQKFIAEIYLRKEDFSSAKMYIEKAVMLAKQFDLKYQIIELYIFYGSYLEAFMRTNKNYSRDYVKLSAEMYDKALKSAKELQINNLIELAAQKLSGFKTFCQLNSINL
ncbi:MAG: hypothetical protein LUG16_01020, partial [Candidatus Gastranaerophilales bacterium]|nr:hypothetical protein [Candidatus Gastranaerophilales bacterium]